MGQEGPEKGVGVILVMGANKTIMSSARLQVGVGRVVGVAAGRGYQRVFKAWGGVT